MTYSLAGKVVFITGAARGIGAATARLAAAKGAKIALVGLEPERLEALAAELGEGHAWFECDVTAQSDLERAVEGTVAQLGGIDVVIANAGIANNGTVAVNPADALCRTVDVNLNGVIRTLSATLPHVTDRRGYMLIISSAAALSSFPGLAAYSASKIGAEHFGGALRIEVAHKGVQIGVAHPAWIDTDLVRDQRAELNAFDTMLAKMPWPYNAVIPVEECARALVEGIEQRKRKIFVPDVLAVFAAARTMFMSEVWEQMVGREARTVIPKLEEEVRALGRHFGRQSTGYAAKTKPTADSSSSG